MADHKLVEIPKSLTDRDWQNKKGRIAKMAGKTGVGGKMKDLEKAWKKVDWEQLSVNNLIQNNKDPRSVDEARKVAVSYIKGKQIKDLRKSIQEVSKSATAAEKSFKSSKVIPKSATALAASVAKDADAYFVAVGDHGLFFDTCMKEFDAKRKHLVNLANMAVTKARDYIGSIEKYAKDVLKNPTAEEYIGGAQKGFFQNTRGMQAALAVLSKTYPEATKLRDDFSKVTGDDYKPEADAKPAVIKGKVAEVIKMNNKVKSFLATIS